MNLKFVLTTSIVAVSFSLYAQKNAPEQDLSIRQMAIDAYSLNIDTPILKIPAEECSVNYFQLSDFQNIAATTDSTSCYAENGTIGLENKSTRELFEMDNKICNCLKDSKLEFVQKMMEQSPLISSAPNNLKNTKDAYESVQESILNKMLLQSQQVFSSYAEQLPATDQAIDVNERSFAYGSNLYKSDQNLSAVSADGKSHQLSLKFAISSAVHSDGEFKDGQCISYRDYYTSLQVPDMLVRNELNNDDISKWNYKTLEDRYYQIMRRPVAERESKELSDEIKILKSKLVFLERNSMVKYFLASDKASEEQKKLLYSSLKVWTHKDDPENDCRVFNSNCRKAYDYVLGRFFTDPENTKIVRDEARSDLGARAERKLAKISSQTESGIDRGTLIDQFLKSYNLIDSDHPGNCRPRGDQLDVDREYNCLKIYSAYCKTLDSNVDRIRSMPIVPAELTDNLEALLANDLNDDIDSNNDFKKFNDDVCKEYRRKTGVQTVLTLGIGSKANVLEFRKSYCNKNKNNEECLSNTAQSWATIWKKFAEVYPRGKAGTHTTGLASHIYRPPLDFRGSGSMLGSSNLSSIVPTRNFVSKESVPSQNLASKVQPATEAALPSAQQTQNQASVLGQPKADFAYNYTNNFSESMALPAPERVENLTKEKRQELLRDLEKDYDQWKDDKGDSLSGAEIAEAKRREEEIKTLKEMLSQQQQLNMEQTKLLNQAISRNKTESKLRETQEGERDESARKASTASAKTSSDEVVRAPASIKDDSLGSSAAMAQKAKIPSARVSKSGKAASDASSADSVLREETKAKMVNVQRQVDGSITVITSSGVASSGNAITLAVTDEQYKMLVANPAGLNLSQIQNRIPAEQIAKLEQNGEITLLLSNGANPPFEVKVEKKDNRLVYSLKDKNGNDQLPVKPVRVHNLEALRSTIGIGRK